MGLLYRQISTNNKWTRITKKESRIFSGERKDYLKTSRIIRKGWYLFGILHTDNNKFVLAQLDLVREVSPNQGQCIQLGEGGELFE